MKALEFQRKRGRQRAGTWGSNPMRGARYHFWPFPPFPLLPAAAATRPQPPTRQDSNRARWSASRSRRPHSTRGGQDGSNHLLRRRAGNLSLHTRDQTAWLRGSANHGVPPAQEDGRAFLAFQINKLAAAAGRTIGIAAGSRALKQAAGPHIDGGQPWRYMAGPSTPAVSQVGCTPEGGSGIMQRRQQVRPGNTVIVRP